MRKEDYPVAGGKRKRGTVDWLASYKAILPLLLCFFVFLIILTDSNRQKSEELTGEGAATPEKVTVESVEADATDTVILELYEAIEAYVDANQLGESVEVVMGDGYIHISSETASGGSN